ncbi:MAG: phosphate acyltransferase PlsX [Alphaproteobacteria bacterium]|nr:MAG: phosphate acyltransferase PlsX [Alphaproteobacteria bacterium]
MISKKAITIAVDAMGGDHGPEAVIKGVKQAYEEIGDSNLRFKIFIPKKHKALLVNIQSISDAVYVDEVIDLHESPLKALKKGPNTTMGLAITAVRDGKADAVLSLGSTGAYIALCWKILHLLPSITKVALPATIPSENGHKVVLDLGASLVVSEKELVQFALMGDAMARIMLNKSNPRIKLLNVGVEEMKGFPQTIKAHKILKDTKILNYQGFAEASQLFSDDIDVLVTDGYGGNIALKTVKGFQSFLTKMLKSYFTKNWMRKIVGLGVKLGLNKLKQYMDWRQHNGAPLLGFSKLAIKGHGDSDEVAVAAAVKMTYMFLEKDLINKIQEELAENEDVVIAGV